MTLALSFKDGFLIESSASNLGLDTNELWISKKVEFHKIKKKLLLEIIFAEGILFYYSVDIAKIQHELK